MPKTKSLSEAEAAILSPAAKRAKAAILPLPKGYEIGQATTTKLLDRLLTAQLIEERSTKAAAGAWRTDDAGRHYAIRITAAGRAALMAMTPVDAPVQVSDEALGNMPSSLTEPRGKLGAVLAAVRKAEGAALDDLVAITGWQKHTVRACITRLRQAGIPIEMACTAQGKRYQAATLAAVGAE
jgi:hypothetical protein